MLIDEETFQRRGFSDVIFCFTKEIRELKRGLQGDSWEFVLSRIEDIEKELDLMLTFLQVEEDKKT